MGGERFALTGARVFDGQTIGPATVVVEGRRIAALLPPDETGRAPAIALDGGIVAPGLVDLQVNGGGGITFNETPTVAALETMAAAHAGLGATTILPTFITDRPDQQARAVAAVAEACARGVPGIAGLHLEGPHLSLARKGAHDPALIRPMDAADLDALIGAARRLPRLMVTLAPESVSPQQIAALAGAGVTVALGHTDCSYEAARAAAAAGARVATHLFNAMSPLQNRAPGLVGAVLDEGGLDCGLIADGVHVHPAAIRAALAAKRGPGAVFLVSDCMAPAGTAMDRFTLNGREVRREAGRLTLGDGTLAGADLDLPRAIRVMTGAVGIALDRALAMATAIPARVLGLADRAGRIEPGRAADLVHLSDALQLSAVWRAGRPQPLAPGLHGGPG